MKIFNFIWFLCFSYLLELVFLDPFLEDILEMFPVENLVSACHFMDHPIRNITTSNRLLNYHAKLLRQEWCLKKLGLD